MMLPSVRSNKQRTESNRTKKKICQSSTQLLLTIVACRKHKSESTKTQTKQPKTESCRDHARVAGKPKKTLLGTKERKTTQHEKKTNMKYEQFNETR